MELSSKYFLKTSIALIAFLWFYAALSKLIGFDHFAGAMRKQTVWPAVQQLLIYGLPPLEIIIGILLTIRRILVWGLYLSAYLFLIFIIYIILVLTKVFGKVPCSCGGLIEHMGWTFHLFFNIAFLILTIITLFVHKKKEIRDT